MTWSILCRKSCETDPYPIKWMAARTRAVALRRRCKNWQSRSEKRKRSTSSSEVYSRNWCCIDHRGACSWLHMIHWSQEWNKSHLYTRASLKILLKSSTVVFHNMKYIIIYLYFKSEFEEKSHFILRNQLPTRFQAWLMRRITKRKKITAVTRSKTVIGSSGFSRMLSKQDLVRPFGQLRE